MGFLITLVDNLFKGLKQGVADRYAEEVAKAGPHPEMAQFIKKMNKDNEKFRKMMKKNGF